METTNQKTAKILLVDDEPNILIAVDFLLQQQGFETACAFDGQQAIQKMDTFRPDIVILDVMMPELDGFEVARRIRNMKDFEHTVIIFLTAKGTYQDKLRGYASGGEIYLQKPFDNDELIRVVQETIAFS